MTNRLGAESSPYLLQHADNPVDWQPWDDAALAEARETGKPILLSIGYSACHWCHVMAHESFEDPATAAVMNALYVNIKVDREERPDLDRIYQLAQQMFTGRPGGWPLTMFLTPDTHVPIFAGTYFPKDARYGMPAFADVLARVEAYYRAQPAEIAANGVRLREAFGRLEPGPAEGPLSAAPLAAARRRLGESYDATHGGFGGAPKFPHPSFLDLLLELWLRSARTDTGAETMLRGTLDAMAAGGLYDHIGGGFFRYCVDETWTIPHFEKMLYDNAALLGTYADAYAATGSAAYGRIVVATADWLRGEMRAPDGAFFATLDADAEGEEGSFYVFTRDEFDTTLGDDSTFAKAHFGLDGPPNFEGRAWHLTAAASEPADAGESARLERVRRMLAAARERRPRPGRDEKILTAWNGLAIGALARAARRLGRPELVDLARGAATFVRAQLFVDGRLFAVWKDGHARFPAYLDDYAFMLAALVELMQTDFRADDFAFACRLADTVLTHFADPAGGCFFTADDHEQLIHRPKPLTDDSTPSGNGMLAIALGALGHLLAEPRYLDAAAASVRAAAAAIDRYPEAHATYLRALALELEPPTVVVVRGPAAELPDWRQTFGSEPRPGSFAFFIGDDELPAALDRYASPGDRDAPAAAYVCTGTACSAPIASPAALAVALADGPPQ